MDPKFSVHISLKQTFAMYKYPNKDFADTNF